jgi:hypothetical protein
MRDLYHPILFGAENIDRWHGRNGDLQCAFPLDVPMVPSFVITVAAGGEHPTCGGISLSETLEDLSSLLSTLAA